MRRSLVVMTLIAIGTLGWLWARNRPAIDQHPLHEAAQHAALTDTGSIVRNTRDTEWMQKSLDSHVTGSYGFDVWQETACDGVTLFYQPFAEDEDVAWFWFDLQSQVLREEATLGEIVQALAPHLEGFERFTPSYRIILNNTPEGRPLYSIGRDKFGNLLQIGFSPNDCSAVPDIAQLWTVEGTAPIAIDLPAAVEQVRQQRANGQETGPSWRHPVIYLPDQHWNVILGR